MYYAPEERGVYLHGKVEDHTKAWNDLRGMMINHDAKVIAFEQRIDRKFGTIEKELLL